VAPVGGKGHLIFYYRDGKIMMVASEHGHSGNPSIFKTLLRQVKVAFDFRIQRNQRVAHQGTGHRPSGRQSDSNAVFRII
jgi:hypothetical protein